MIIRLYSKLMQQSMITCRKTNESHETWRPMTRMKESWYQNKSKVLKNEWSDNEPNKGQNMKRRKKDTKRRNKKRGCAKEHMFPFTTFSPPS